MITNNRKKSNILWYMLLFSILCFPRILQPIKIILCGAIIMNSLIESKFRLFICKPEKSFLCLWFPYAFITIVVGIIYGNNQEGILGFFRVNIMNCIIYLLIIICINRQDILEGTYKTILYSTFYISVYNLLLIIGSYAGINLNFIEKFEATARVGIHTGYTHIVTTNLSMTIITFPFLLGMTNHIYFKEKVNHILYYATIIMCALSMILSGRRILWIALVLGGLAALIITKKDIKQTAKFIGLIAIVLVTGMFVASRTHLISIEGLYQRLLYAFSATDEYGALNVRDIQGNLLVHEFLNRPILGNGAGAILDGFIRNKNMPWAYELSYHVVLFQSGILGSAFYFGALISLAVSINIIKQTDLLLWKSSMILLFVALVANATNPYFSSSFDFLIFLYLPLLFASSCQGNLYSEKMKSDT